jgi:hypothetical protein
MANMIEKVKCKDISEPEKPVKKIGAKPMNAIYILLAVGTVFLLVPHAWLFGIILLGIGLLAFFSFHNYIQVELYQDHFLFYPSVDSEEVISIRYEDIQDWSFDSDEGGPVVFSVTAMDGSTYSHAVLNWQTFHSAFKKVMADKEKTKIHKDFIQENTVINWRNIFPHKKKKK